MLASLVLAFLVTVALNRGIDFRADGTTSSPSRFEQFLHGWWLTFFSTSVFFAADHILTQTWMRWRLGPEVMDISQFSHSPVMILPYLALGGLSVWAVATVLHAPWAHRATKRHPRYQWEFLVAAIAVLGLYQVPSRSLNHAVLATAGPGTHAADLLSRAAATGDLRTVELLEEQGVEVATLESDGQQALHSAIIGKQAEIVKWLLARGANINDTTSSGATAMSLAALSGSPALVELLMSRGAEVPCARWHLRRWQRDSASLNQHGRKRISYTDTASRRYALLSDSAIAGWAAEFGRTLLPCEP